VKQSYSKREQVELAFKKYLPESFVGVIVDLFLSNNIRFKIVNGRKTKLGDFRAGMNGQKHQITVNGDLNPYSFLITTLHEFAHLHTYISYQRSVRPHGEEWKRAYRQLLIPVIDSGNLPKDIEHALLQSLVNTKASSCTDHHLSRVLHTYDKPELGIELLEQLPRHSLFLLDGREFIKGELRRKRYICKEVQTNRNYLVNALAKVYPKQEK
jgi:hypothetical protein